MRLLAQRAQYIRETALARVSGPVMVHAMPGVVAVVEDVTQLLVEFAKEIDALRADFDNTKARLGE